MAWLLTFLLVVQLVVAVGLIVVILLQRSKGEGLGSIGGGAQMFFERAKGVDRVLEQATKVFAVLFMLLAVVVSLII